MIKVDIPQIENNNEPGTQVSAHALHNLLYSNNFGRLFSRTIHFEERNAYINDLLKSIYVDHAMRMEYTRSAPYAYFVSPLSHKIQIETVIYWIRKTVDEIISILYWAEYYNINGYEPSEIKVDCINKLLDKKEIYPISKIIREKLGNHDQFLINLNDVSNAYKHSLVNGEAESLVGENEPTVVAFLMDRNRAHNNVQYHSLSLKAIINAYSKFFIKSISVLKSYNLIK